MVTGTKEALIAHDLATADDFDRVSGWADIANASGYTRSRIDSYMEGLYRVNRQKLPPRIDRTPAQQERICRGYVECVETIAAEIGCAPEAQAHIRAHVSAIIGEIKHAMQRPARRGHLRLVVDNARA